MNAYLTFITNEGEKYLLERVNVLIKDPSDENKAKYKAAKKHFETLNEQQLKLKYYFNFLTPEDYDYYFNHLKNMKYNFKSKLDAELEENGD